MHCDQWIVILFIATFSVSCDAYNIEESNSVILKLGVPLEEYLQNPEIQRTLFELIANYSTINCSEARVRCNLAAKYGRDDGDYQRTITQADYVFDENGVHNYTKPEVWVISANSTMNGTSVAIYLTSKTGYDLLEWTHLVRLIYYHTGSINEKYKEILATNATLLMRPPTSYLAMVINQNVVTPTVIACSILGSALILFIILVPLSNTRYCRKEVDNEENKDKEAIEEEETAQKQT